MCGEYFLEFNIQNEEKKRHKAVEADVKSSSFDVLAEEIFNRTGRSEEKIEKRVGKYVRDMVQNDVKD